MATTKRGSPRPKAKSPRVKPKPKAKPKSPRAKAKSSKVKSPRPQPKVKSPKPRPKTKSPKPRSSKPKHPRSPVHPRVPALGPLVAAPTRPPRGFKSAGWDHDRAITEIRRWLGVVAKDPAVGALGLVRVVVHPNRADGSIDGELSIQLEGRGSDLTAEQTLYEALAAAGSGTRQLWVSLGARYVVREDDEVYRKFRGMNQVQTNYQLATSANLAEEHLITRRKVLPGMRKTYRRSAALLFVRLHWGKGQPKR